MVVVEALVVVVDVVGAGVGAGGFVPEGVVVLTVLSVGRLFKSMVVPTPVAHTLNPAYWMLKSLFHTICAPCATDNPCLGACPFEYRTPSTVK